MRDDLVRLQLAGGNMEGELTEKFWREFPDGTVPIRHFAPSSIDPAEDFVAWAEDVTARRDALSAYDHSGLIDAYSRFWRAERSLSGHDLINERRSAVLTILAAPLSIRQAAIFLGLDVFEVLRCARNRDTANVAGWCAVSDAYVRGCERLNDLIRDEFDLHGDPRGVQEVRRTLRRLHTDRRGVESSGAA